MAKWFEVNRIKWIRRTIAEELALPEHGGHEPTAAEFWARAEKAGLLEKALALYYKTDADWAAWEHMRRETKQGFAARIEREGRKEKVDRLRAELLKAGYTQREIQEALVEKFQPLNGTSTRVWPTPDPWEKGRLFRKKSDQNHLIGSGRQGEEVGRRVECAKQRRDERVALAAARRRARELAEAAKESKSKTAEPQPTA